MDLAAAITDGSIHLGHHHIGNEQIDSIAFFDGESQGLHPAASMEYPVSFCLQRAHGKTAVPGLRLRR